MITVDRCFPPQGNPAITTFFTNPGLIKSEYELIDSTHTLNEKSCYLYKASVCVGVFLELTTGYQSKGSSIVELINSSIERTWHITCTSPNSLIADWTISFFNYLLNYSKIHHVQEVDPKFEPLEYQK